MANLLLLSFLVFVLVILRRALTSRRPEISWAGIGIGCLVQVILGVTELVTHTKSVLFSLPAMPLFGLWRFQLDTLSGLLFLVLGVIGVASALTAIERARHLDVGTSNGMAVIVALQFVFTTFLVTADNAIPLLISWEGMSLCAYAYILVSHHLRHVRRAAFVTLFVSEVGFLLLVVAVILAAPPDGVFDFSILSYHLTHASPGVRDATFILALLGFGAKSGILPMQIWMPDAYDAAPAHLNAILAGGLLNLGLYGILRVVALTGPLSAWLGLLMIWLGAVAFFFGALYAAIEPRLRRLLAYSSVENVGIMVINLGLATVFIAHHNLRFANVAMMTLLVQLISHALAKGLAFLAAGEIGRQTGSTHLDDLGGLLRVMPGVGLALLVSCLTLAAVAPFSGFAAEWLTMQGMIQVYRSLSAFSQVLVAMAGILGATGSALALTTFLKVFAFSMTGPSRSSSNAKWEIEHHRGVFTGFGLGMLAVLSTVFGWLPTTAMPSLQNVNNVVLAAAGTLRDIVPNVFHHPAMNETLAELGADGFNFLAIRGFVIQPGAFVATIGPTYVLFWFMVFALLAWGLRLLFRPRVFTERTSSAWLGGKKSQVARSQYTSSAYVNPYRMFWQGVLGYRLDRTVAEGSELVPVKLKLQRRVIDWLAIDHLIVPTRVMVGVLGNIRRWQHGYLWGYMLTIVCALLLLIGWAIKY